MFQEFMLNDKAPFVDVDLRRWRNGEVPLKRKHNKSLRRQMSREEAGARAGVLLEKRARLPDEDRTWHTSALWKLWHNPNLRVRGNKRWFGLSDAAMEHWSPAPAARGGRDGEGLRWPTPSRRPRLFAVSLARSGSY